MSALKTRQLVKDRRKTPASGCSYCGLGSGRCIGPVSAAVPRLGWRLGSSFMPLRQTRRAVRGLTLRRLSAEALAKAEATSFIFYKASAALATTQGRAGGHCEAR